jgi:tRNA A37 threonylcarbamoyladenosine biosynthesis protein TsaE
VVTLARTTFFGRTREKERLAELLDSVPLVTLTGVGGAGKTRLAAGGAGALAADIVEFSRYSAGLPLSR